MTPEDSIQPFLMQFSHRIDRPATPIARYNETRCLVQYLIDHKWIDAPDAPVASTVGTRETHVHAETTDDR